MNSLLYDELSQQVLYKVLYLDWLGYWHKCNESSLNEVMQWYEHNYNNTKHTAEKERKAIAKHFREKSKMNNSKSTNYIFQI